MYWEMNNKHVVYYDIMELEELLQHIEKHLKMKNTLQDYFLKKREMSSTRREFLPVQSEISSKLFISDCL